MSPKFATMSAWISFELIYFKTYAWSRPWSLSYTFSFLEDQQFPKIVSLRLFFDQNMQLTWNFLYQILHVVPMVIQQTEGKVASMSNLVYLVRPEIFLSPLVYIWSCSRTCSIHFPRLLGRQMDLERIFTVTNRHSWQKKWKNKKYK